MVSTDCGNLLLSIVLITAIRFIKQALIMEVLTCVFFVNHSFYRVTLTNGAIHCLFVSGKGAQNRSRLRHARKKSVSQTV